jgi:hypothetical protein
MNGLYVFAYEDEKGESGTEYIPAQKLTFATEVFNRIMIKKQLKVKIIRITKYTLAWVKKL